VFWADMLYFKNYINFSKGLNFLVKKEKLYDLVSVCTILNLEKSYKTLKLNDYEILYNNVLLTSVIIKPQFLAKRLYILGKRHYAFY